ncbi:MAG: sulfatase-like hydrolase/transferase, partial [Alphaproteobacteria bacterium]|nr:sulfatase-like hydrolase/transferase [Alphaproteobacteria bacterium]
MRRSLIFISLSIALVVLVASVALVQLRQQPGLNVLLLTIESTRFDAISKQNTPFLWRKAKTGHQFLSHRTASAWTGSNIVSILTGLSTFRHGVHSRDVSVPASWRLPLETLKEQGWDVGGLQSFMLIDGFQNLGPTHTPGERAQTWMATRRLSQTPFFLWRHYLDTHLPYNPPGAPAIPSPDSPEAIKRLNLIKTLPAIPAKAATFQASDLPVIRALYDAQFQVFDTWFQSLWAFLEKSGLLQNTILLLTTDHGEELLERGNVGHASTTRAGHLHEEIAHIPLIIWTPPGLTSSPPFSTTTAVSAHTDIMPTIFALLGVEPVNKFEGVNLFDPEFGAKSGTQNKNVWMGLTSKAGFAEENPGAIRDFVAAIKQGDDKVQLHLRDGAIIASELYDLRNDPAERHNLALLQPERMAKLRDRLMRQVLTMRIAKPIEPNQQTSAAPDAPPEWIFPAASGVLTYDALPVPLTLKWRGARDGDFIIQYQAGTGISAVKGEMNVSGNSRDFGRLSRHYWDEY